MTLVGAFVTTPSQNLPPPPVGTVSNIHAILTGKRVQFPGILVFKGQYFKICYRTDS